MSWVIGSDAHSAGDTGHITDHNNAMDVLTDLAFGWRSLYAAPSVATAETFPRMLISTGASVMVSGTLYCMALGLHQNTVINNLGFATKGTAETGGTHAWFALLDNTMTVRAVTADQTGATALGSTNTHYQFSTNSFTTTYSGLYYASICVVASGMPVMSALSASAIPSDVVSMSPILCGSSSTGLTTPPSTGTAMTALTAAQGYTFWAYTA